MAPRWRQPRRAPTSTAAAVVFGQGDLLALIFGFQAGLPKALSDAVRAYRDKLRHVHYLDHPDLRELTSPPLLRGYILCRLVAEARISEALLLLRFFPLPKDVLLPRRLVPLTLADTMDNAARAGSLPLLQALHSRRFGRCTSLAMDVAAGAGDLAIVQFLYHERREGCSVNAYDVAQRHPRILEFLEAHRPDQPRGTRRSQLGRLAASVLTTRPLFARITQYQDHIPRALVDAFAEFREKLHHMHYLDHPGLCHLATDISLFRGYVLCRLIHDARVPEALLLLRTFGQRREIKLLSALPNDLKRTVDNAAAAKSLALVAGLHECRFGKCTSHAMDIAAANGDLAIVQFLHEHRTEGCTRRAFEMAAKHKHTEVLAFLTAHRPADQAIVADTPACILQ
ncbi:hypothetical protein SDRG_12093 [Saprolegnia diclina VS20]|uniref:Uncharacterized protein n=1 Tax=Saprolegnia diclina (strain VS20) TaxID=1156394 RepID=T0RDB5_SAPDV|nr:hypothetical protein SDRG_12093 [Saprolegnia diclina VS20]EQC30243.1 hypothetical protein SDRG_12093 [Saprolegnia diclina VS20]|eukprot:XP_008616375.1 hypothetical protein SDRG_12093 [Saprolegnia diclina VS20]